MYVSVVLKRSSTKPGSDSGSDRIGLVSAFLMQNYYFVKSCLTMTHVARIFSSEPPVSLIKKIVSRVSPGLKFTISLKIIAKNYLQLNCTGKFSVA